MWNLMRAHNYQARRDNFVINAILIGLIMMVGMMLLDAPFSLSELSGDLCVVYGSQIWFIALSMVIVLLMPRLLAWDMTDKTINYEVMTGYSRTKVYLSRAIVSILWSVGVTMLLLLGVIGFFTFLNGWGNHMDAANTMKRILLLVFPLFRFACEVLLLTMLLKNCYVSMVIGFVLNETSMVIAMICEDFFGKTKRLGLAMMTCMELLDFTNYKFVYIGGEDVAVYETAIESSYVMSSIGVSLLVGVICLGIGYIVFRKRDMD